MSQPTISSQMPDIDEGREQLLRLLNEALNLADALTFPPEIGARIQEVIDLTGYCRDPGDPSC